MGPIRGYKKRRKTDKRAEENASASASASGSAEKEGSVDWWDEFSKRINEKEEIEELEKKCRK